MVFRGYTGLVNASMTTLLPHSEPADPVALVNSLQVDSVISCYSSRQDCHLTRWPRAATENDVALTGGEMELEAEKQISGKLA